MVERAVLAAAVGLGCLPLALPAHAEPTRTAAPTMVFERTTDGPASLKLFVANAYAARPSEASGPEVVSGIVGVRDGAVPEVVPLSQSTGSGDVAPSVRVAGQRYGCESNGCGAVGSVGFAGRTLELSDDGAGDPDAFDRVYVVQDNARPDVQYDASGWRLVVRPLTFRYVTAQGSAVAVSGGQASLLGGDADVFTTAALPGGEHGSLATGVLPCGLVSQGTGRLTDGQAVASAGCSPTTTTAAGLAASGPADWVFAADGAAVGQSEPDAVRLLVIDLPPPDRDDAPAAP